MKLLAPILGFGMRLLVAAQLVLFNRYEAGQRWGTSRSWLPAFVQDARFDADSATREEIVRKSRYFERNNAIVNRLADLFEQYTVGCGLQINPASSSEEWNQAAKAWFEIWSKFCDLTSLQSFGTIQSLVARAWFIDGEVFILKTRGREYANSPAKPRIQLIEAHRVATPQRLTTEEGKRIVDGIELDGNGRPVAYHVRDGFDENEYRRIPAEQIIHVFEPSRPGMYRGLPFLYPVLNDIHDLDDLELCEMKAAKQAAETATFIETASGELSAEDKRRERFNQATQKGDGTTVDEARTRYIKDAIGGRVAGLKMGEKVTQFVSQRPSVTVQWYWDYLTSKICAGSGISKLLVYPWSMQGTVTRADLDVMSGFFHARSAVLGRAFSEVFVYVMGWANANDPALDGAPPDWFLVNTRAPRSVNVDVGRNSSAMLAELKAGARTYQDVYAELGQDWREQLRQKAKEAAFIRSLATVFKVEPGEIADVAGEAILSAQPMTAPASNPPKNVPEPEYA